MHDGLCCSSEATPFSKSLAFLQKLTPRRHVPWYTAQCYEIPSYFRSSFFCCMIQRSGATIDVYRNGSVICRAVIGMSPQSFYLGVENLTQKFGLSLSISYTVVIPAAELLAQRLPGWHVP